jgi:hypothetical protein
VSHSSPQVVASYGDDLGGVHLEAT